MPDVRVEKEIVGVRQAVAQARQQGARIGLVPTMGALHEGHASLIRTARTECDFVAVSIFVNPTQFAPHEDFHKYPRPFEADVEVCRQAGAALIFHPEPATIYPAGFCTSVEVAGLSSVWEGAIRPTHFRGVTTVVLKLLNIVLPDVAYFGRKDFQQQLILHRMCRELDWPYAIRTCPTVREVDGLALSSRNVYLSPAHRAQAVVLSQALFEAQAAVRNGERDVKVLQERMRAKILATPEGVLDYAVIVEDATLDIAENYAPDLTAMLAVRFGTTRLIDNVPLG